MKCIVFVFKYAIKAKNITERTVTFVSWLNCQSLLDLNQSFFLSLETRGSNCSQDLYRDNRKHKQPELLKCAFSLIK